VISSLISIILAFRGWGVWSLVVGQLTVGPITFLLAHFYEPWRITRVFSFKAFKELVSYGGHISAGNVINYASVNLDNLIIGRYLGSQTLGIYSLAYKIMQTPLNLLSRVVPQALFPVFSGIQDDERSLVRGYLRSTHYVVLVMFPMMAGCIVLASEIISVLFGEKWLEAIPLVQILCVAGAMKSAGMNIAIVFKAKGRPDVTWKWNLFILFLYIPLFFGALHWGSSGIALVISGLSIPLLFLWQFWLTRIIKVSWDQYWRSLKQPFIASLVMAGIILAIKQFRFMKDLEPLLSMLLFICLGALIYCGMILLFDRNTVTEIRTILKSRNAWIKRPF
jgi:teichuronic acid exporter